MRVRVRRTGEPPVEGLPGTDIGPVRVEVTHRGDVIRWRVFAHERVALDAVSLVWDEGESGSNPLLFSQGYQSWAPTRTVRLGVDQDPSRVPHQIALVRAAFHADPGVAAPGEVRSEQVAVLAVDARPRRCIGFTGGEHHAGTIRARIVEGRVEIVAEAWLGGAVLSAGERRSLHDIVLDEGDDASMLLEQWATRVGVVADARAKAPFIAGWCSWYHYFNEITERDMRDNLARANAFPFDVFQLDDGYQRAIGDWLETNDRFPSGVEMPASEIAAAGLMPGIWIAPFLAAPDSALVHRHPEWLAHAPEGDGFAIGMYNEIWGGVMAELDTTQPEVCAHLEATARALVDAGYRYLKLDFTFSAAMPGRYADPTRTPAERVRAGYDAIRRGAGDDVFILGCGAPIGACVGVVDGMRIGADVAPWWDIPPGRGERQPGYELATPATRHAFVNTCTRSFMHRRLWSNDPDCVMLRTSDTELSRDDARRWAETVACSGGLVLVSDDLALLDEDAARLLESVVAHGRIADDAARAGASPRCVGLLDPDGPSGIESAAGRVSI
jgi:alpha-galactosidase